MISTQRLAGFLLLLSAPVLHGSARAQSDALLRELGKLHEQFVKTEQIATTEDARRANDRLAEWKLTSEKLQPPARIQLHSIETCIGLALGDAARAKTHQAALAAAAPNAAQTHALGYLVACACGDAQLADRSLSLLAPNVTGEAAARLAQRRRWSAGIGRKVEHVNIRMEDGSAVDPAKRGDKALVIDFWNMLTPPTQAQINALTTLYAEYKNNPNVEFVGVDADNETRTVKAREFAKAGGYAWPQAFEQQSSGSAVTHGTFHAGNPPWTVVVDSYGFIRAIADAGDAGLICGLRAAIAEARGDFEPTLRSKSPAEATTDGKSAAKPAAGGGEKPSNPEAASKLREAIAFFKTGKKTLALQMFAEIVRDYPGTPEAHEAQFYLD